MIKYECKKCENSKANKQEKPCKFEHDNMKPERCVMAFPPEFAEWEVK